MGFMIHSLPGGFDKLIQSQETLLPQWYFIADIPNIFSIVEEVHYERKTTGMVPLSDTFFNPGLIYTPGQLDKFLQPGRTATPQDGDELKVGGGAMQGCKSCNIIVEIVFLV